MKIITASYAQLINLGNFENVRVELAAAFGEGEDVDTVVQALARAVQRQLSRAQAERGGHAWVYQDDDGGTIPPS